MSFGKGLSHRSLVPRHEPTGFFTQTHPSLQFEHLPRRSVSTLGCMTINFTLREIIRKCWTTGSYATVPDGPRGSWTRHLTRATRIHGFHPNRSALKRGFGHLGPDSSARPESLPADGPLVVGFPVLRAVSARSTILGNTSGTVRPETPHAALGALPDPKASSLPRRYCS
jgi:hypothetical protein